MSRLIAFVIRYIVSLGCVAWAHTLGLPFKRNREFIRTVNREFGFTALSGAADPPEKVPGIGVEEVLQGDAPVKMLRPEFESGGVTSLELICINRIVRQYAPKTCFEIGTFNGRTTLNIAANTGDDTVIYALDLPLEEQSTNLRPHPWDNRFVSTRGDGAYFRNTEYEGKIRRLYGDTAAFDFRPYAGTIDLIFVDASHSYEYVTNDSLKALPLLRNGTGVILWHDYGTKWHDVTHAVNDLFKKNPVFRGMKHIRGTSLVMQVFA